VPFSVGNAKTKNPPKKFVQGAIRFIPLKSINDVPMASDAADNVNEKI
jgi:hypothetical protein